MADYTQLITEGVRCRTPGPRPLPRLGQTMFAHPSLGLPSVQGTVGAWHCCHDRNLIELWLDGDSSQEVYADPRCLVTADEFMSLSQG